MPGVDPAALEHTEALSPAVDQFLFEVYNAGKIPMPSEVARRFRELTALVVEGLGKGCGEEAVGATGFPLLLEWIAERNTIRRQYPPPRVSREIRDLMQMRALRTLKGASISAEQDREEQSRIDAAHEDWPAT